MFGPIFHQNLIECVCIVKEVLLSTSSLSSIGKLNNLNAIQGLYISCQKKYFYLHEILTTNAFWKVRPSYIAPMLA